MASMATATSVCRSVYRLRSVHESRFSSPCNRLQILSNLPIKPLQVRLSNATVSVGFVDSFPSMAKMAMPSVAPRTPHPCGSITIVSKKGYKMKTHKASAKRFRVTGNGKIMRRRAGKQHLLAKKNTKRKNRLSKMQQVSKSDYDNVIGALPYLKVNRHAS